MIKEYRFRNLDYIISYPDGYVEGKRYPIIFHTPGAGARGRNLALIEKGIALLDRQNEGNEYLNKCLIVIPQCYAQNWFDIYDELRDLCDYIYNAPFTDKHWFYGSGISMGGYAIYQLFMTFADRFAAGIVCCGGGMYWNAEHIKDIPLWIFHGIQDDVIFVEEAIRMTEKLRGFGGKVKLTLYDNCCHDSWTKAYSTPELYEWLLSQSR